jgi:hypothetical protein
MADDSDIENLAKKFAEAGDVPKELEGVQEAVRQALHRRAARQAKAMNLPEEFKEVRDVARRAIHPLKAADANTQAEGNFLFTARRTDAGRRLPPYYLVYFLLVELLGFRNLGQWEKTSWSVPVDLDGVAYLIEHRKFGLGVFAKKTDDSEQQAERIVALIKKGVKAASLFYAWKAQLAIQESRINVSNVGAGLYERYIYFVKAFKAAHSDALASKEAYQTQRKQREFDFQLYSASPGVDLITTFTLPWITLEKNASWLALAAVDAFFAWTEHIFIHLAILQSNVTTGSQVARLTGVEWGEKFKVALNISEEKAKDYYDRLGTIRRQLRNFVAHGAFGKAGEAFTFHSGAGAVPVVFDGKSRASHWSISPELAFDDAQALATIEEFIGYLWSGPRAPAKHYIQESSLPLILPMASDGTYRAAMASVESMKAFVDYETRRWDDAGNMDW